MNITEVRRGDRLVVAPVGRLDSNTAPLLDRHLSAAIQRGDTRLVLDLAGIDYVSSTGLSVFLSAAKKIKPIPGGSLSLSGLNSRIRLVFEMSGFLRLFPIFTNVDEAVAQP
ncbi:STAS domain-containing protein [Aureimonas pseudogalii]|uniref:Anti-sigma factor antagonist n=1 Tax=Aureimonas pseudogalii TaxID=1744844 RepID=A0A7W6H877_9HYPH|nr:STAS domain-containing protein [Aureimonas pseudogalii]MBB4000429.1 anti-anti-sigma factor [Aureimonas pseudogalii]